VTSISISKRANVCVSKDQFFAGRKTTYASVYKRVATWQLFPFLTCVESLFISVIFQLDNLYDIR